ncbi:MAG TPA: DegT/DnrJ/EryC1/StrS family aminotransferase, partial [Trueperaceae bacterium]|nr:DegT/DnrJ/EryC1/StrS family aminotransferase [Trueperaceae bacterium]
REVAERYTRVFGSDERFQTPVELDYGTSAWHLYVLRLNRLPGLDRNSFVDELKERNIGFSVHYRPLHMMSYYRDKYGFTPDQFPVAKDAYERMVSLPLHPRLTEEDVSDVISTVLEVADEQMAAPSGGQLAR